MMGRSTGGDGTVDRVRYEIVALFWGSLAVLLALPFLAGYALSGRVGDLPLPARVVLAIVFAVVWVRGSVGLFRALSRWLVDLWMAR
jgi:hypothetical protein